MPSLRRSAEFAAVRAALCAGSERGGFRLVHFSVQTNHLHLLAEAQDRCALSRGVQGLGVRIARVLNRLWRRTGGVFDDRYHDRILRTPREVRNALAYVLHNTRHHGSRLVGIDPFSSGPWFDGWGRCGRRSQRTSSSTRAAEPTGHVTRHDARQLRSFLPRARTWLLEIGWRMHGLIALAPR